MYHLSHAGLPVPAPVAARYRRAGLTYSGDLITERIVDSASLSARLAQAVVPILNWIRESAVAFGRFHDCGVVPPRISMHTTSSWAKAMRLYLIDF